jgi:hypothetical protein
VVGRFVRKYSTGEILDLKARNGSHASHSHVLKPYVNALKRDADFAALSDT